MFIDIDSFFRVQVATMLPGDSFLRSAFHLVNQRGWFSRKNELDYGV